MIAMEFHGIANWFPMMDDAALGELAADIKANGLIEPITLFDGKILRMDTERHAAYDLVTSWIRERART